MVPRKMPNAPETKPWTSTSAETEGLREVSVSRTRKRSRNQGRAVARGPRDKKDSGATFRPYSQTIDFIGGLVGAARRSRTPNLQIRSLSLYPVELWLHVPDVRKGDSRASRSGLQPPHSMRPVIGEEAEA